MLAESRPLGAAEFVKDIDERVLHIFDHAAGETLVFKLPCIKSCRVGRFQEFAGGVRSDQLINKREERLLHHGNISGNIIEYAVQREQDRHLDDQLHAAAGRGYAVLAVHFLDLRLLSLHRIGILATLVFLVDLIELRLHLALKFRELLLLDGKRQHSHVDQNGHDNDRQTDTGKPDLVQDREDPVHEKSKKTCNRSDDHSVILGK